MDILGEIWQSLWNKVECFVEKPSRETAKRYLASGEYLWNSGMFIWKTSTVMKAMKIFLPDIYGHLVKISSHIGMKDEKKVLQEEFPAMRSISIDYGIMEKASDIYILHGMFGWDDVGSWLAVERFKESDEDNNIFEGNVISAKTRNCIIEGGDRLIAAVGLDGIVVVDTDDITLISDKLHIVEIKKILDQLRQQTEGKKYL